MSTAETSTSAAAPPAQTMRLMQLPLDAIQDDGDLREARSPESVAALAESIRVNGLLVPIRVEDQAGLKQIIDGRGRLAAHRLLGRPTILSQVLLRVGTEAQRWREQLVANCLRENLSPLEQGRALENLLRLSQTTAAQVARETGFSESKVSRLLELPKWPVELQQALQRGDLSLTVGSELARLSADERPAALAQALARQVGREQLASARKLRERGPLPSSSPRQRVKAELGAERVIQVSAPDLDLESLIGLLQELLDQARKARTKGLTLTTFVKRLRETARAAT